MAVRAVLLLRNVTVVGASSIIFVYDSVQDDNLIM